MSQSDAHRRLIIQVVDALTNRYPSIRMVTDLQVQPGDDIPPLICGVRPDVYGRCDPGRSFIIAEAKTDRDLDNRHTSQQIATFIRFLEQFDQGLFVLAVSGRSADRAKTVMRFLCSTAGVIKTRLQIFDGYDFWLLNRTRGISWHLD